MEHGSRLTRLDPASLAFGKRGLALANLFAMPVPLLASGLRLSPGATGRYSAPCPVVPTAQIHGAEYRPVAPKMPEKAD